MASGRDMGGVGRNTTSQRDKDRTSAVGAGTAALSGGGLSKARGGVGRNDPVQKVADAAAARTNASGSKPGGGTTTQEQYTPGAVGNFPDADGLTVAEKIFGPLIPGAGSALGALTAAKTLAGDDSTVFGGDPGPQRGWQPDKYRGQASLTGLGGDGGAVNGGDIPGSRFNREVAALTGDSPIEENPDVGNVFSDLPLKDRRRPYAHLTNDQLMNLF